MEVCPRVRERTNIGRGGLRKAWVVCPTEDRGVSKWRGLEAAEYKGEQGEGRGGKLRGRANRATNMIKEELMMGSTKLLGELGDERRVVLTEENSYTMVRVLYKMGIVVMPGWAVVMS